MQRFRHVSFHARVLFLAIIPIVVGAAPAAAATLPVCASGCPYSDLQAALNAAQPGDTILLRAGETFVGNFRLPVKNNPGGAFIVIRSDAPDGALPAAGTRLVPNGYTGGNTAPGSLARLVGRGGQWKTTPVIEAELGAHHYRLQFLDIDGLAQEGWETIVQLGTSAPEQSTLDAVPYDIVLDRVFVHGHPTRGQKRCVALNARNVTIENSYISACSNFSYDSQAVAAFNGPGPFKITNNYLEASGENVLFGGADPRIVGLVPSDIEITRNHIAKPPGWRDAILGAPGTPALSDSSGAGSLGAGAYYFKIVAVLEVATDIGLSPPSGEQGISVGGNGAVALSWSAVAGADRYRIYIGNSPGGQDRFVETSGAAASFTYSGGGETWQPPPAEGTRWNVKNLLELKNAQRVLIDGNIFEYVWPGSQTGYAVVLTPRNSEGGAPWSLVRDVTFTNNILRHVAGGLNILGYDDINSSERTTRITIRNNLAYDISSAWGGASHFVVMTGGPSDVHIDHNTIFHDGMVVLADTAPAFGFQFTNNVAPHNTYGVFGSSAGSGTGAMNVYFPDGVLRRNALGGGPAAQYPPDNFFPDMTTFMSQFVSVAGADFRLAAGSLFRGAATDGTNLGVDFNALAAALPPGAIAGDSGGSTGSGGSAAGGAAGSGSGGASGGSSSGAAGSTAPAPFRSVPASLPGVIQAEDFDEGGAGVAYADNSPGNDGGEYRTTDVDIAGTPDAGGGYTVGWVGAGEWLRYSVTVAAAGSYDIDVRVASAGPGGSFHIDVNGVDVTGSLTVPDTGGWQSWETIRRSGVSLSAGAQVWRLVMDSAGPSAAVGNINFIAVSPSSSGGAGPVDATARDIVLYAADVTRSVGNWNRVGSWSGAGNEKMQSADAGWSATSAPLESPSDFFEMQFVPEANRAYRVWVRLRGGSDSKFNESVWVQFSGALDANGGTAWGIGTDSALLVNLESCSGCGIESWGWQNGAWWLDQPTVVRFGSTTPQTVRVQTREDGVEIDQIVLSPVRYFNAPPGLPLRDTTIVQK